MPLAINLQRRARTELENRGLINAQTIASSIGAGGLDPTQRDALQKLVSGYGALGRAIVVDVDGTLVADSDGPDFLGELYATPGRPEIVAALDGRSESVIRHSEDLDQDILATAVPIRDEGGVVGAVRITQDTKYISDNVRRIIAGLIAIGVAGLVAGLVIAFALAGSFSRPLSRLAAAARRLGRGDLSSRAKETSGASEIVELAGSFDEMADRLEATVQAQREFVANASHQLRTPLTGMKLRLESAIAETSSGDVRRQLEAADREVDRLAEIVERLLVLARRIELGGPSEVDVGDAVARAIERWQERAARHASELEATGDGGLALADRADLDQVLDNLLENAIRYAPGLVVVETGQADGRVFVAVQDGGPGISPDEVGRVTERFFRGRGAPSGGSGLGLAIVRELAEKWGGAVEIQSPAEGGTRVEVHLSASDSHLEEDS